MMFYSDHVDAATELLELYRGKKLTIATAESCTGGMIGALLTDIAGASDVFQGGFITYSNELKHILLGVNVDLLNEYGAVSDEVACAMAEGAAMRTGADYAVAVTGVAGPGGGTAQKPVGLVYVAVAGHGKIICKKINTVGSRQQVRSGSVASALNMLRDIAS